MRYQYKMTMNQTLDTWFYSEIWLWLIGSFQVLLFPESHGQNESTQWSHLLTWSQYQHIWKTQRRNGHVGMKRVRQIPGEKSVKESRNRSTAEGTIKQPTSHPLPNLCFLVPQQLPEVHEETSVRTKNNALRMAELTEEKVFLILLKEIFIIQYGLI